ncbi:hypothetical protein V8F20_005634 [Naviculisporaceae sp. PSN 640]
MTVGIKSQFDLTGRQALLAGGKLGNVDLGWSSSGRVGSQNNLKVRVRCQVPLELALELPLWRNSIGGARGLRMEACHVGLSVQLPRAEMDFPSCLALQELPTLNQPPLVYWKCTAKQVLRSFWMTLPSWFRWVNQWETASPCEVICGLGAGRGGAVLALNDTNSHVGLWHGGSRPPEEETMDGSIFFSPHYIEKAGRDLESSN